MTDVTLQKFLEDKVCALDKRIDQRFIALDKALELQAEKNEKHLDALNHEQQRLAADRERYLPRETYAADRKDRVAIWISVLALVIALATFVFRIISRAPIN